MFLPRPTPQDLRDRAGECEQRAASAISAETRETLLYLAKRWRALADEDEAKEKITDRQARALR